MPKIPEFKNLDEEREFWDTHSVTDYLEDMEKTNELVFKKKAPAKHIVIRLYPEDMEGLKKLAIEKGLTISALARMFIREALRKEMKKT